MMADLDVAELGRLLTAGLDAFKAQQARELDTVTAAVQRLRDAVAKGEGISEALGHLADTEYDVSGQVRYFGPALDELDAAGFNDPLDPERGGDDG